jgi:hypothetical protein
MQISKAWKTVLGVVLVHGVAYWATVAAGVLGYLNGEPTIFLLWTLSFFVVPLVTWPDLVEARHWGLLPWAGVTYAVAVPLLVVGTFLFLMRRKRKQSGIWVPPDA